MAPTSRFSHRFASFEKFAGPVGRRLRDDGILLPATRPAPVGTVLELDFRLEDETPLLVGRGEVTEVVDDPPGMRVRFLELTPETRRVLAGLSSAERTASPDDSFVGEVSPADPPAPVSPPATEPDPDDSTPSVVDLVAQTYGGGDEADAEPPRAEVMRPPDGALGGGGADAPPASAAATPAASPSGTTTGGANAAASTPATEPSPGFRITLPFVALLLLFAGLGAGAVLFFDALASVVLDQETAEEGALDPMDIPPSGVEPSRFPPGDADFSEDESGDAADATGDVDGETVTPTSAVADAGGEAEASPLDRLRLITWEEEAGGTRITLWGNGAALADRLVHERLEGANPRELLKLQGVDLPFRQPTLSVGTSEVARVRTGFHPRQPINELHVVIDLAAPGARLTEMETDGATVRLFIAGSGDATTPATGP